MHAPALLRLSLFGPVQVRSGEREVKVKSLKLRALLGYIALSESLLETRERLVGLLWSESGEAQARAVLRQVIRELRNAFAEVGSTCLRITPQEIGLQRDAVEVDVWSVVHAAEAAQVHPLLLERPNLMDELLTGLEDLDPAFRVWVMAKRRALRDRLQRALENALAEGRLPPREEGHVAEALFNLDPTHEDACRRLMRLRAAAGDIGGALRCYKALWDLLDEEYGMEPSSATQQLVAEIKLGAFDPGTAASATVPPPQPVLSAKPTARLLLSLHPVTVEQVDPDKAHLVVGFRQLLIASLVRFREWQVTDMPFSVPGHPVQGVGGHYDIHMFAHQSQAAVHLTIMLKELETGFYVWSDGFELKLENWFGSQRRVVRRIAMALNVHLSADRLERFSEQPDISLSLYDRWLRCQTLVRTFNPQLWQRLEQQFTEIIQAAPSFVPAYCGLADMHNIEHIAHPGIFRTREREQKALELARKAVQLDPADMRAHRCMAWAHIMAKQYAQAVLHLEVAIELNPSDSWTVISGALLLAFCGEVERAAEFAAVALDLTLSPSRTHWAYQADIQFLIGDYQAAIDAADRAQDILWGVAAWRAAALAHLGRRAEAEAEGRRFLGRVRDNWFGTQPATDEAIVSWLLHLYPISRREDWERLRDGLRLAGLPTGTVEHHAW